MDFLATLASAPHFIHVDMIGHTMSSTDVTTAPYTIITVTTKNLKKVRWVPLGAVIIGSTIGTLLHGYLSDGSASKRALMALGFTALLLWANWLSLFMRNQKLRVNIEEALRTMKGPLSYGNICLNERATQFEALAITWNRNQDGELPFPRVFGTLERIGVCGINDDVQTFKVTHIIG